MPTCEESVVNLIDRAGTLSAPQTRVRFIFKKTEGIDKEIIAGVQVVSEVGTPAYEFRNLDKPDAPWKMIGSTDVGAGDIVLGDIPHGHRVFLIKELQERSSERCCEALELVCGASFADFAEEELRMLVRKLFKLLINPKPGPLDCSTPLLPD